MLTALGVDETEQWLLPELKSWNSELQDHSDIWTSLHDRADCWLELWISRYQVTKTSFTIVTKGQGRWRGSVSLNQLDCPSLGELVSGLFKVVSGFGLLLWVINRFFSTFLCHQEYNRYLYLRSTVKWKPLIFTMVDVLNYFCSVQKEDYRKARYAGPPGHNNTVLLPLNDWYVNVAMNI